MDAAQTGTKLTTAQQDYILWCATGLYWPEKDEEPTEIEYVSEFSRVSGTPRRTLYNWERDIEDFWDLVNDHRTVALDRKLNKYYKWAEEIAKPLVRPIKDKKGNVIDVKVIKPGNVQAIALLVGQAGRTAPSKVDHTTKGEKLPAPILGGVSATSPS